ncbi:hypothetical protein [Apilactobacillus xinyiensis]|nr:hypothetical protein [Apilactobacillus xinyiensis]
MSISIISQQISLSVSLDPITTLVILYCIVPKATKRVMKHFK